MSVKHSSPPEKIKVRWWIRFTVGPVPVRLALFFAFLAAAAALYSVAEVQTQVNSNSDLLHRQDADRRHALSANIRARFDDCRRLNDVRHGLRVVITESHSQVPPEQLKRLFPQLPDSYVPTVNHIYHEELAFFADDNCTAYANRARPTG